MLIKKFNIKGKIFIRRLKKYIKESNRCKFEQNYIFNGPVTGNIGDHAILIAENFVLESCGKKVFNISAKEMEYFFKNKCENIISPKSKIYITGGGNTGTLWRNEQNRINIVLKVFCKYSIIIFPQTIFYEKSDFGEECFKIDKKYLENCKDIEFQCRDKKSYNFVKENFNIKVSLKKDMALNLNFTNFNYDRKGILLCFRNDIEKNIDESKKNKIVLEIKKKYPEDKITYIDTVIKNKKEYSYKDGKREFYKMIKKFAKSKLVVTDRLHGMIISYITNTPCIAFNNKSGKVKGVYETIDERKNLIKFVE